MTSLMALRKTRLLARELQEKDILCPEGLQAMGLGAKTFHYSIALQVL